ncbi:Gfo/Idh/MocA family protein [Flavihumibacter stibioxidans]|uniref:Oxidoreductase n=1 Tax=Flavihumibacter stibioxidans TaxID=1834163 RepID=A0ABR7M4W2_9BACT|nr:Gfo/Idh/MocA family oxidoreductase [Flavihumibacter stibioxidans]MBC6490051.1 oxidoreductase [Flavihumibacter stibioxidans]
MGRKLRMGMIGGGRDAFIGGVHRIAAFIDGEIEMVCGAFSSNPEKSKLSGEELKLSADRVYGSFEEMILKEKELPADKKMDFVSIVTPNHLHFAPAKMAMEHGFHVVLDKPATFTLAEAIELKEVIDRTGALFCLTHTYTGYPMIKEAKHLIATGKIGKVRKVFVEYPQGWLTEFREGSNYKQAAWRTDPKRSGISGCMGDIGTHAFNMAEYVSGLQVQSICADLHIVVPGRLLDDDGAVLLKFEHGATGFLYATQVAAGEENNLKIRVYGELGGIEWQQEDANTLQVKWLHEPTQILRAGTPYLSANARFGTRTPPGHPEGYLEAFANLYRNFALTLQARLSGDAPRPEWLDFPGIEAGIRGMAFIENVIASSKSELKWTPFDPGS